MVVENHIIDQVGLSKEKEVFHKLSLIIMLYSSASAVS